MLRGILAGAGLSLAAVLISYRTGLISIAGESAVSSREHSQSRYGTADEMQKAIAELRDALPAKNAVSTDPDALTTYGSSPNSYHPESPHSVVVHVTSTEDVVKVVNIARKYRVPVVAYGGATSIEGHFSGVRPISNLGENRLKLDFYVGACGQHLLGYLGNGQDSRDQR
jgi:D-lactate dehydrogenase (cytochrome)